MLQSRVTWAHSSFIFNEHISNAGAVVENKAADTFRVDERTFDPSFRDARDPYHLQQGGGLNRVHKGLGYLQMRGALRTPTDATQLSRLADRELAFRAAFDPDLCARDSPTTDGAYYLTWKELTADLTNFPSGQRGVQFLCRPTGTPQIVERLRDRTVRDWTLGLVGADPRFYGTAAATPLVLTSGTTSGVLANIGNVWSPLRATIVTSANGGTTFRITRNGVNFGLNLSSVGATTIVVVFETCAPYGRGKYILNAGVEAFNLKSTAVDTWHACAPGNNTFSLTGNIANVTSVTLETVPAWA